LFSKLKHENLSKIARSTIQRLVKNIESESFFIDIADNIYDWIAEKAIKDNKGVRSIYREIDQHIYNPLFSLVNKEQIKCQKIEIIIQNNQIRIKKT